MIVSATDLHLTLAKRSILAGVDLEVDAGERCAIVGRSGSGKTSLLLLLAGLLTPTSGRVTLDVPGAEVVYIPQAPSLVPELTARQNAAAGLRVRGLSPAAADQEARKHLRALGLEADDALPAELSGGMQQRVALARALAVAPKLLLADEPTGALDQTTGRLVMRVLSEFAASTGAAVVVATHDPDVAAQASRQFVLGSHTRRGPTV